MSSTDSRPLVLWLRFRESPGVEVQGFDGQGSMGVREVSHLPLSQAVQTTSLRTLPDSTLVPRMKALGSVPNLDNS